MNISLTDALKAFVDAQVAAGGYGASSGFVRALIRKEQEREQLRRLVVAGIESGRGGSADAAYFESLRSRIRATSAQSAVSAAKQSD